MSGTETQEQPNTVYVTNGFAYVAEGASWPESNRVGAVEIFSVTNPASPLVLGRFDASGPVNDIKVARTGKGSVPPINNDASLRAKQFAALVHAPIWSRRAIHFRVIVVSRLGRRAILTSSRSPLRRAAKSDSFHLRRFHSPATRLARGVFTTKWK